MSKTGKINIRINQKIKDDMIIQLENKYYGMGISAYIEKTFEKEIKSKLPLLNKEK